MKCFSVLILLLFTVYFSEAQSSFKTGKHTRENCSRKNCRKWHESVAYYSNGKMKEKLVFRTSKQDISPVWIGTTTYYNENGEKMSEVKRKRYYRGSRLVEKVIRERKF